ncbi:monocarboxylate transporter 12-like [Argopecten irradians]|uniref:monocarboxylate transporter 12-like n=1 Tax=Argopecten irradians TaxID=31199 RepID=UPI00371AA3A4
MTSDSQNGLPRDREDTVVGETFDIHSDKGGHSQDSKGDNSPVANGRGDNSHEEEEDDFPTEGCWGWVIVFGSLMIHIILFGIEKSSGIFFLKFDEKFQQPASVTAWVTTVPGGLRSILGPVCSLLTNRFSFRPVVLVGAILMCIGMLITAFATNMAVVFFSFAIIEGVGMCLVYCPAVVIVGKYFSRRRGMAVGIATSSFGSFLFPTLIEFCFEFYGFLGAFLLLSGISLNIMVFGSLFTRPPERKPITLSNKQKMFPEEKEAAEHLLQRPNQEGQLDEEEEYSDRPCHKSCFRTRSIRRSCVTKCKQNTTAIMRDPRFAAFCIAMFLFSIAANSAYAFIPLYAKQIAITDSQTTYVVAITILADGLGKVCVGALLDLGPIKPYRVLGYNLTLLLVGVAYLTLPSTSTFVQLCSVASIFGLLFGGIMSQKSVVLADILGVNKLADAFGILMLFQGAGSFVGPPVSGLLKDLTGNSNDGFYFGGVTTIVGALLFVVANILQHRKT